MNPPHGSTRKIIRGMDTGLYNAAVEGLVEVIQLFRDSLTSQLTATGNTMLHVHVGRPASKGGVMRIQFIETVLDYEESLLWKPNDNDEIPLHLAAKFGHADAVQIFIRRATARSVREMLVMVDKKKDTALHRAVRWNHHEVVKLLLLADPDCPYGRNDDNETPLYIAADQDHPDMVSEILDTLQSPAYDGPLDRTALHAAVFSGNEGMLKKILDKNNNLLKSQDNNGQTALHYAVRMPESNRSLEVLLHYDNKSESTIYIQDSDGRTALHMAALYASGDARLMKLTDHRPDCSEIKDNKGQNIVHYAASSGDEQKVKYLLGNGIFSNLINEKDLDGNTPLLLLATSIKYSQFHRLCSMKTFVKEHEVDLKASNNQNLNARDILLSQRPWEFTPWNRIIAKNILIAIPSNHHSAPNKVLDEAVLAYDAEIRNLTAAPTSHHAAPNKVLDEAALAYGADLRNSRMSRVKAKADSHLIVTILIATVSFAAGIAVPGGFNQETGADQGTALLTRNHAFKAFMIADTLALSFSAASTLLYFHIARAEEPNQVEILYSFALLSTTFSIGAMMAAFMSGTYSILYQSSSLAAASMIFPGIFMCIFCLDFLNKLRVVVRLPAWMKHCENKFITAVAKACG